MKKLCFLVMAAVVACSLLASDVQARGILRKVGSRARAVISAPFKVVKSRVQVRRGNEGNIAESTSVGTGGCSGGSCSR